MAGPTNMNRIGLIVAGALVVLMLAASTLFVVDQRQVGVVYALGEIKEVITEPGLKFKMPPPFQNVVFLDKRIQTLDSPDTRPIFTAEKKSLLIDWMVKWRINDPRQFIRNNGTDIRNLESRLSPVVQAAFNEVVTRRTVSGMLATEREKSGFSGQATEVIVPIARAPESIPTQGLARALEKLGAASGRLPMDAEPATAHMFIVNPLRGGGGVKALFTTHPPMAERIHRLETMAGKG